MNVLYTWENNSSFYNDIWGYVDSDQNEYAIIGTRTHFNFVNVSSNANASLVNSFAGSMSSSWRDMKTYSQWAYGCTEANEGLSIFFMGDNPSQNGVSFVAQNRDYFTAAHNIFIDEAHGRLYAIGTNTQSSGVIILDIKTNPEVPILLNSTNLQGQYIHDMYVEDHIGYANCGGRGLYVYDFSDPNDIKVLGTMTSYPEQGYNHSCWLNEDDKHLIMADETHNTGLKVVDVSDPTDIEVLSTFRSALLGPGNTRSIAHNPFVRDDYVIISYYHEGIQVFDMSNPNNVKQVAWYDTEPDNTNYSGFDGAWGAYPYLPSGKILGSDVQTGLYVLKATDITFDPIPPVIPPTASLNFNNSVCIEAGNSITLTVDTDADVIQWFKGFTQVGFEKDLTVDSEGTYTVKVYKGPHSKTLTVTVGFGEAPEATLNEAGPITLCEGATHLIEVPDGQNNSYTWLVNGFISQNQNGNTFEADNIGVYQVIVSNGSCETYSEEFLITGLENGPELSLNFSETQQLCSGAEITLEVPEGADAYQWYQNGIAIDGETSATYTASTNGNFYVEGTLGDCTINSDELFVQIISIPNANLNFVGNQELCDGESVNLEIENGADNYDWYLNEAIVFSGDSNEFLATESGEYYVIASTLDCQTQSEIFSLTVNPNPTVEIDQVEMNQICGGEDFTFTTSGIADSYVWFLNSEVIPNENGASITVAQSGAYEVFVSIGDCNASSSLVNLSVLEYPVISNNGSSSYEICEGDDLSLQLESSIGIVQWSSNGQTFIPNENPIIVNSAGTYEFTATNGICSSSEIISVTIREDIEVTLDALSTSVEVCEGDNYILNSSNNGSVYNWYRDGVLLDENTASLNILEAGNYSLEVIDGNCSGTSETISVSYSQNPEVSLLSLNGLSFCEEEDVTLEATDGFQTYEWYRDGQLLIETSSTLTALTPGNYQVFAFNDLCQGQSNILSITQEPSPIISLESNGITTICEGDEIMIDATAGYQTYQWFLNSQMLAETGSSLLINGPGNYQVYIIDDASCEGQSNVVTISQEAAPSIDLQSNEEISFCLGQSQLIEPIVDASSYEWYQNGNLIADTYSLNISEAGNYYMIASNGSCSTTSNTITVSVINAPSVELNMALGQTICEGEEITLRVPEGAENYEWVLEGEIVGTSNELVVSTQGFYFIRASNGDCVNQSMDISVTVISSLDLGFNLNGPETICNGESITLAVAEYADVYNWMLDGNTLDQEGPSIEISEAGNYTLTTMREDCISESGSFELIIQENPTIEFTETELPSLCEGDTYVIETNGTAEDYAWYRNGEFLNNETTSALKVTISGIYTVQAANGDCEVTSEDLEVIFNRFPFAEILSTGTSICENSDDEITLSTQAIADAYSWILNGEIVGSDETLTTNQAGAYTLTLGNANCTFTSEAFEIESDPSIEANIIASTNTICEGGEIVLETNSMADEYVWFFNGNEINDSNVGSITVSEAGTYTLYLSAQSCSSTSEDFLLEVVELPEAVLNVGPELNTCEGESSTLNIATGAASYTWYFNNEIINSDANEIEVSQSGIYYVVASNNNCHETSETVEVVVDTTPEATLNVGLSNSICAGEILNLEVAEGDHYEWFFNGESIGNNMPTLSATAAGTYQVMLTNNVCSATSQEISLAVIEPPVLSTTDPATANYCEGDDIILTVDGEAETYSWIFNDQEISNQTSLEVLESGIYQAIGYNGTCGSEPIEFEVNILESPDATLNVTGAQAICEGESLQLITNEGYDSYQWFRNTDMLNENTNKIEVNEAGTYYLIVSLNGCEDSSVETILEVTPTPLPIINSDAFIICPGERTTLNSGIEGADSYAWFANGNLIKGSDFSSINTDIAGVYSVVVSVNGCFATAESVEVTEYEVTLPNIDQINNILKSSSAGSYQWYLDGEAIEGVIGQGHTALTSGLYYVVVIDENGCESQSEVLEVIISSIAENVQIAELKVYPNPVADILTLEYNISREKIQRLSVYNELGINLIRKENLHSNNNKMTLDITHVPAGIYYLEMILASGARSTVKFVKMK